MRLRHRALWALNSALAAAFYTIPTPESHVLANAGLLASAVFCGLLGIMPDEGDTR